MYEDCKKHVSKKTKKKPSHFRQCFSPGQDMSGRRKTYSLLYKCIKQCSLVTEIGLFWTFKKR